LASRVAASSAFGPRFCIPISRSLSPLPSSFARAHASNPLQALRPKTMEKEPQSTEVERLEGEVGPHAHHSLVHFRLFEQLKQRNLVRIAVLYLVGCWLILEPVHVVFQMAGVPEWANRLVLIVMTVGFPAVLIFSWVYEFTPEGLKPAVEVPPGQSIRKLTGRRLDWAIIAALAVALAYFVVDKLWISKHLAAPPIAMPAAEKGVQSASALLSPVASSTAPPHSIAVLPFVDLSEKKDQEYFSDGLSEELIDLLARVPDLRVPARTSSFYFKGRSDDISAIARQLHVANVLEGSVRKAGNTIRITVQLIRADSGFHVWSNSYDRDLRDIFKIQDEIAESVIAALKVKLALGPVGHRTDNSAAYNEYLLGRQFDSRGTSDAMQAATQAYRKAVELDPGFSAAYAGLAIAEYRLADDIGDPLGFERAKVSAEKAVELAPEQADGYAARGFVRYQFSWDWDGARADLEKALTINPSDGTTILRYSGLLWAVGRHAESIVAGKKAIELDPLSNVAWQRLGIVLTDAGQLTAAHDALARALEINPESAFSLLALGKLELLEGKGADALATFRRSSHPTVRLFGTAAAEHTLGNTKESQQALAELIETRGQDPYQAAEVYAWQGDRDNAFKWLERAFRQRDGGLSGVKGDPMLASLRSDPRFVSLLRKMNLPD